MSIRDLITLNCFIDFYCTNIAFSCLIYQLILIKKKQNHRQVDYSGFFSTEPSSFLNTFLVLGWCSYRRLSLSLCTSLFDGKKNTYKILQRKAKNKRRPHTDRPVVVVVFSAEASLVGRSNRYLPARRRLIMSNWGAWIGARLLGCHGPQLTSDEAIGFASRRTRAFRIHGKGGDHLRSVGRSISI